MFGLKKIYESKVCLLPLCRCEEITSEIKDELEKNNGFVPNVKRGTAYQFRYELSFPLQTEYIVLFSHSFYIYLCKNKIQIFKNVPSISSVEALESFLARNSLTHVIRAHEVQDAGFQV